MVKTLSMSTKEQLARLMKQKSLTNQSELARRLEPPEAPTWIGNRLSGYSQIKADEIPRLAKALGVSCHSFFQDSDCPEEVRPSAATSNLSSERRPYMDIAVEGMLSDLPEELRELVKASLRVARLFEEEEPPREQAS